MKFQDLAIICSVTVMMIGSSHSAHGECGVDGLIGMFQPGEELRQTSTASTGNMEPGTAAAAAASAMADLLDWVVVNTPYDAPENCPLIDFRPAGSFPKELCPVDAAHCGIGGYYRDGSGTIILRDSYRGLDDIRISALIVHEMSHFLQDQSGIWGKKSCGNWVKREREAYRTQQRYLVAHHGNPFGLTMSFLNEAACPDGLGNF